MVKSLEPTLFEAVTEKGTWNKECGCSAVNLSSGIVLVLFFLLIFFFWNGSRPLTGSTADILPCHCRNIRDRLPVRVNQRAWNVKRRPWKHPSFQLWNPKCLECCRLIAMFISYTFVISVSVSVCLCVRPNVQLCRSESSDSTFSVH